MTSCRSDAAAALLKLALFFVPGVFYIAHDVCLAPVQVRGVHIFIDDSFGFISPLSETSAQKSIACVGESENVRCSC